MLRTVRFQIVVRLRGVPIPGKKRGPTCGFGLGGGCLFSQPIHLRPEASADVPQNLILIVKGPYTSLPRTLTLLGVRGLGIKVGEAGKP